MKIEIAEALTTGPVTVRLSHGKESAMWDVSAYGRTSDRSSAMDSNRIFEEINTYWATLPAERQTAIWETYQQIKQVLETNFDISSINIKLMQIVKKLYDLMPLHEIRHWRKFHSNIRIPSSLKDTYGPEDPHDQTYLRADYEDLVVLAIALRPMVPVWGVYIGNTRREVGSTFKEVMAMALLHQASIVRSEPMERLRVYVEASVARVMDQGPSATAVLGGVGSTELPDWILSLTVVRRLAVGEVSASDDSSNLITNVYQYISNKLKSMDRTFGSKFGGKVSDKTRLDGSTEETKASVVEMYKVKQEVSDGELVTVNVYTEQTQEMALKLEPELDLAKLQDCLHCVRALENQPIQKHQIVLTQWVMAPCLPARGIPLLIKPALLRAMAVTQAVLWQWGFHDLAALTTATPLLTRRDEMFSTMESRGRIPKELISELERLYPHYPQKYGKQTSVRQLNVAARAVDGFCELISNSDWQLHAPLALIEQSSRLEGTKKLLVPGDIRTHLARLIMKIAR